MGSHCEHRKSVLWIGIIEFEDCIAVLHTFHKKSKTGIETPKKEIDLIKERIRSARVVYREQHVA